MTLGDYIKQLRAERGLSLSELSRRSGVGKSLISNIENNISDPQLATITHIAKALDMGAGDLLVCAGYTVNAVPSTRCYTLVVQPNGHASLSPTSYVTATDPASEAHE